MVGHLDDLLQGRRNPNCMYLWMDYIISPAAQAKVAECFGEAPVNLKACELTKNKNHCDDFHADDEAWWERRLLLDDADQGLRRRRRGDVCKTQEDWKAAWTEIRG